MGVGGETIENSLLGFEKSIRLGVTNQEMDIVLSKDGVLGRLARLEVIGAEVLRHQTGPPR